MTESNAPYVYLHELIERAAKGPRHGTRRELRVMLGVWTDRPNELNNQIQNTLAMKLWSVEFSTGVHDGKFKIARGKPGISELRHPV
jgi:hypothetical protein